MSSLNESDLNEFSSVMMSLLVASPKMTSSSVRPMSLRRVLQSTIYSLE
jgi:hypothetical protein